MSGTTGSSTASSDVSLNDLSANHNNDLFANAVTDSCGDALAGIDILQSASEDEFHSADEGIGGGGKSPLPNEEKQLLLADNTGYVDVAGETENLWNKAIKTVTKNTPAQPKLLMGIPLQNISKTTESGIVSG